MNSASSGDHRRAELDGFAEHRLHEELAVLRAQREQLRGDSAQDQRAADAGDRAEALRRADDVFRIEDRINEINHLLAAGAGTRPGSGEAGVLGEGSTVTLRFPDGDEEKFYASSILDTAPGSILDTAPGDTPVELLGLGSPLAKAIAGHSAGDTIRWHTPTGAHQADVVTIHR